MEYNFNRDLVVGLGTTTTYTNMVADVTSIVVEHGFDVREGITPRVEPPYMIITLRGSTFDPLNNANVRQNKPIFLLVKGANAYYNNAVWGATGVYMFKGYIDEVTVSYDEKGTPEITIVAYNEVKRAFSIKVDSVTYGSSATTTRLQAILNTVRITYSTLPTLYNYGTVQSRMPAETITDTTSGEIIQDIITAEGALFWHSYSDVGNVFYFYMRSEMIPNTLPPSSNWIGFSTVHNSSPQHFCITGCEVTFETANQPNWIRAELSWDSTTYVDGTTYAACKNATSIATYGVVPKTIALNLDRPVGNPTQYLKAYVDDLTLTRADKRVKRVTSRPIMPDGRLNGYLIDPNQLGAIPIPVTIQRASYSISEHYYATRIRNNITPTNWEVEYELWKGV